MANFVEELMISIGIDAEKVKAGLGKLQSDMAQLGKHATTSVEPIAKKIGEVGSEASKAGAAMNELGSRWGGMFKSLIARYAMPLAGALSIGNLIGRHMGAVGQVAQMTGAYFTQLEEYRKKRAMLQRVNKEDIELYRKGRLAMLNFNLAVDGLSTTFMRALSPVVRVAIDWLNKVSEWVSRNEPNIVRFLQVVAGVITAVLIPTFLRLAAVMLANPFTWLVMAILAVIVVIDDLVTYINGGESALEGLWSTFGTGEEIAASLGEAWEVLKSTGLALWDALKAGVTNFFSYFEGAVEPLKTVFVGVVDFIKALFNGDWIALGKSVSTIFTGAFDLAKEIVIGAATWIKDMVVGIFNLDWGSIIAGIGDFFKGLLEGLGVWDTVKEVFSTSIDAISTVFQGFKESIVGVWNGIKAVFGSAIDWVKEKFGAFIGWIQSKIDAVANIGKKIKNFFGFGDGDDAKSDTKKSEKEDDDEWTPSGPVSRQKQQAPQQPQPQQQQPQPQPVATQLHAAGAMIPTHAQAQAATTQNVTNTTNKNTNIDSNITVNQTINAQNADANGLMQNAAGAAQGAFGGLTPYAADTGVAQ